MKICFLSSEEFKKNNPEAHLQITNYLPKNKHQISEPENCDGAIIEASYPSNINIGFEIGTLLSQSKPVILIYKEGKTPEFITNPHYSKLISSEYNERNLEKILDWCFEELNELSSKRFTFYISKDIEKFIEDVSKEEEISKSEYIRNLIEKEMVNRNQ